MTCEFALYITPVKEEITLLFQRFFLDKIFVTLCSHLWTLMTFLLIFMCLCLKAPKLCRYLTITMKFTSNQSRLVYIILNLAATTFILLVQRVRSRASRIAQLGLGFMKRRWCGGRVARSAPWPRTNSGEIDDSALSASVASAVAPPLPSTSIRYFTHVFVETSDHFVLRKFTVVFRYY